MKIRHLLTGLAALVSSATAQQGPINPDPCCPPASSITVTYNNVGHGGAREQTLPEILHDTQGNYNVQVSMPTDSHATPTIRLVTRDGLIELGSNYGFTANFNFTNLQVSEDDFPLVLTVTRPCSQGGGSSESLCLKVYIPGKGCRGCQDCSDTGEGSIEGEALPGPENGGKGTFKVSLPAGKSANGDQNATLDLNLDPAANVGTADFNLRHNGGALDTPGTIRTIQTDSLRTVIQDNQQTGGMDVEYRTPDGLVVLDKYNIRKETVGSEQKLVIEKVEAGSPNVVVKELKYNSATSAWSTLSNRGLRRVERTLENDPANPFLRVERVKTYERPYPDSNPNGVPNVLVSDVRSTYETFKWGEELVKRQTAPDSANLTETWTYHQETAGGAREGWLATRHSYDGSSETHQYSPTTHTVFRTHLANSLGRSTHTSISGNTTTVEEKIGGTVVGKRETIRNGTTTTEKVFTNSTDSLQTVTVHYPVGSDFGGLPSSVTHPDGTLTTYSYTRHPGGEFTTVTELGATTSGNTVAQGMRNTVKVNAQGKTIESSTRDIESGVILSQTLATTIDAFGRPTHVVHDNEPADYETFAYSCCGLQSHRARDGTTTSYIKDALARTLAETTTTGARVITRTYDYTPVNGLPATKITTTASGVTGSVVLTSVTDHTGRLVSETAPGPMGIPETTTYDHSPNGLVTTRTNPDGGTVITESYPDGKTKSITGTATIHRHYTYTTHNENGGGEVTTVTTAGGVGGQSASYTDLAGRTFKTTRTAPHNQTAVTLTTYNALGQVETVASSGQPTVKYLYNAEGERIATWTDRNGDGQFNDTAVAGVKDSCTTTQSDYLPAANAPAGVNGTPLGDSQRTITTVRTEANEDVMVSIIWESVDGLRSREESVGVANPAIATRTKPLNGAAISTQTNPDGTSVATATTILANGNTQTTSTSYTSGASPAVIETNVTVWDAMERTVETTNGRGHVTEYSYHADGGQTASVTQVNAAPGGGNLVTQYDYTLTYGTGRLLATTLPDNTLQYQESNLLGQTSRKWGSQTNPVSYAYDTAGRRASLTTYRAGVCANAHTFPSITGDTTTWVHDPSGVVLEKIYADGTKTSYTYDIAKRVATRTWARGVVTTYGYAGGQLTSTSYTNDPANTPSVITSYDRLGRVVSHANGVSVTVYTHDEMTLRLSHEVTTIDADGSGPIPSLTRTIDRRRDALQRSTGLVLGDEHAVGYGYDDSGRLSTISAQGLPNLPGKSHAFEYTYEPGSSLHDKVTGPVHEVDNDYETHRNVLLQKKNARTVGTPGELSIIGYTVNSLGQRVQRNLSGEIRAEFYGGPAANPYATNWSYDALGQVTSEDKPSNVADRGYTYDLIGNRISSTADSVTTSYTTNVLNQYAQISVPSVSSVVPIHDQDGNMTNGLLNGSGSGQFEYDGANQLIRTQSTATSDLTRYAYDAFGRRIAKITYPNAGGPAIVATVFLYDGWNLIAEYVLDSGAWLLDRTYTWGTDLSGTAKGAGGVGGLLAVTKHQSHAQMHFYPIYDGNGNVEAYLDSNGVPAAIYQYDASGNLLSGGGKGAALEQAKFSHRFSSKYQDAESGLLYYGYRYYDGLTGRWTNRDPIEENGGINLYLGIGNGAVNQIDPDGRILPLLPLAPWIRGGLIGVGINLILQITINVASGDDWYNINISSLFISFGIGAVFPGVGTLTSGLTKALKHQEKAIRIAEKMMRRAPGNLRLANLARRAQTATEDAKAALRATGTVAALIAFSKVLSYVVNKVVEEVEKQFKEPCPPQVNETHKLQIPIEMNAGFDTKTGDAFVIPDNTQIFPPMAPKPQP